MKVCMMGHGTTILCVLAGIVSAYSLQQKLLLHVAPMQAYTNRFLRYFYRFLSPDCVLFSEMEKLEDLLESEDACSRRLAFHNREHPLVLQLGGNSPSQLKQVLAASRPYQYDEINLNVGCPSIETGGANYGAALMTQPKLVQELMDMIRKETDSHTKVSIKCRIGVHDKLNNNGSSPLDTYETLHGFISTVTSTGSVDHVIVHARSAILGGLSSVKNRQIPPLRYDFVHQLSRDFPSLSQGVTLNGGIRTITDLQQHMKDCIESKVQGLMLGRWLLQRPLDLVTIDRMFEHFNNHNYHDSCNNNHNAVINHLQYNDKSSSCDGTSTSNNDHSSTHTHTVPPLFSEHSQESITDVLIKAIEQYAIYAQIHAEQKIYPLSQIMLPLILISEQLQDDWNALEDHDNHEDIAKEMYAEKENSEEKNHFEAISPSSPRIARDPSLQDPYSTQLTPEQILKLYQTLWNACDTISVGSSSGNTKTKERKQRTNPTINPSELSFRKLQNLMLNEVGKKVANKIIRNRNEL